MELDESTDPALDAEAAVMEEREKLLESALREAWVMGVSPETLKTLIRESGSQWDPYKYVEELPRSGLDTDWRLWD